MARKEAKRDKKQDAPELVPTRLMLATPPAVLPDMAARLETVMGEADVACLVVDFAAEEDWDGALAAVLPPAQRRECAVLLTRRLDLLDTYGADGVHATTGIDDLEDLIERYAPRLIVGAGELRTKHDAMEHGEAGADYVLFGRWAVGASDPDKMASRAEWWAALFEVPCVAVATDVGEAERLARLGADFVMPALDLWEADDLSERAASYQTAIEAGFAARLAERRAAEEVAGESP